MDLIILATRRHFAQIHADVITMIVAGTIRVPDAAAALRWQDESRALVLSGAGDHTFTFRQFAHFLRTGEIVSLLPRSNAA